MESVLVGIGEFGAHVVPGGDNVADAIAIVDRPLDVETALGIPSVVVRDARAARQLGEDLAEVLSSRRMVVLVGDVEDPLYRGTAAWIAELASEFDAGTAEVVAAWPDELTPSSPCVGIAVPVLYMEDAVDVVHALAAVRFDRRGLGDLGTGRVARFAAANDFVPDDTLEEAAARALRRLGTVPEETLLAVLAAPDSKHLDDVARAVDRLADGRRTVHVVLTDGRYRSGVALFAITERGA